LTPTTAAAASQYSPTITNTTVNNIKHPQQTTPPPKLQSHVLPFLTLGYNATSAAIHQSTTTTPLLQSQQYRIDETSSRAVDNLSMPRRLLAVFIAGSDPSSSMAHSKFPYLCSLAPTPAPKLIVLPEGVFGHHLFRALGVAHVDVFGLLTTAPVPHAIMKIILRAPDVTVPWLRERLRRQPTKVKTVVSKCQNRNKNTSKTVEAQTK
jgi:hypothetical protein